MAEPRIIDRRELEQFHGRKFSLALRILRAKPRELRAAIARCDDVMLGDCDEVIIVDRELCERMREIARVFVATHPADGHTLTSFERSYFDGADALIHVPDLDIFVCPETRHFRQALEDARYIIIRTTRGAKICAPHDRLDMVRGIAQTIAWFRANPSGETQNFDSYYAQYSREVPEDSRMTKTHFKQVALYVHALMWHRGWPMAAHSHDLEAIAGIRFE